MLAYRKPVQHQLMSCTSSVDGCVHWPISSAVFRESDEITYIDVASASSSYVCVDVAVQKIRHFALSVITADIYNVLQTWTGCQQSKIAARAGSYQYIFDGVMHFFSTSDFH